MTKPSNNSFQRRVGLASLAAAFLLLTLGALQASADTFDFKSCHVTGGCTGTSFGTVTLTQSGTSVNFDVKLASGENFVETGSGGMELFLFNDALSGSTITNAVMTTNSPTGGLVGFTNLSPVMADGTGTFTASVECLTAANCNGNSGNLGSEITFTVTNATLAQLETTNAKGNIFVADIIFQGTGFTGPVDVSVPEPASMLLFGTGLVALGAKLRRRKPLNPVIA